MATVQSSAAATSIGSPAMVPFKNEAFVDFTQHDNARAMREALDKVSRQLGREYDNVIGGHRVKTEAKLQSINPSHPEQVVGKVSEGAGRRRSGDDGCGAEGV